MLQTIFAILIMMQNRLIYRRFINWIAAIAILFAALSTSMGHVFAKPAVNNQLTAVCTSTGMQFIQASALDSDTPSEENSGDPAKCSYCCSNHFAVAYFQERQQFDYSTQRQPCEFDTHRFAFAITALRLPPSRAPPQTFSS